MARHSSTVRPGRAWHGRAGRVRAWHGKVRHSSKAWQGVVARGKARHGSVMQGEA